MGKTPKWFDDWRNGDFQHFKQEVKWQLGLHSKLLWIILGGLITLFLIEKIFG